MNILKLNILSLRTLSIGICTMLLPLLSVCQEVRSIDGFGNNIENPQFGASHDVQVRLTPAYYKDQIGEPYLSLEDGKPNPRSVSNVLFAQDGLVNDPQNLSDFTWVFGQFIDHDITLVENSSEAMVNIVIPEDDIVFDPGSSMVMQRNKVANGTGTDISNPRQFANEITAFVDGSAIYGSDQERADWLRTFEDGKLKVSEGNLLPWNTKDNSFNSSIDFTAPLMVDDTRTLSKYFVAGDVRANENPLLIAYHTLFVREHNRQCDLVKIKHPGFNDERIYQAARNNVIAVLQNIVYNEWLPAIGVNLPLYSGYKANVEPRIFNEFSAAAFRFGHTLINSNIIRMGNDGTELKGGSISLRDAFFNPVVVNYAGGIDPFFKGMATQVQQDFDCKIVDDVRNFLFGGPGSGGLDLAAININRGRDRGLADFNNLRNSLGFPMYTDYADLTDNQDDADDMSSVYGDIDNLDAWVGMLAEKRNESNLFGEVVSAIIERQFQVLRDGDRFYFENNGFDTQELAEIKATSMRDVIMRNTDITLMQDEVFRAMPHENIEQGPKIIEFSLDAVIYPNPVSDKINLKIYSDIEENVTVTLLDYQGKTILTENVHMYEGSNYTSIDAGNCPRGLYNVILETDRRYNILKMVKE